MNLRFVARGVLLALPVAVLAVAVWLLWLNPLWRPLGPTPPPPTIVAPRGEVPHDAQGLQEFARYRGEDYRLVGSGFLLSLPGGEVVAATTAHSVAIGDAGRPLERIAFGLSGQAAFVGEFDTLRGPPGRARTGNDMTVDYVLLHVSSPVAKEYVLIPDPRGTPQPGERVLLLSGVPDGGGQPRFLEGTVQSVSDEAVWVLMDEAFNPSLMSGSPVVSLHTGQVVGMAVAGGLRRDRVLLGLHPVASLVERAAEAVEFPRLGERYWQR